MLFAQPSTDLVIALVGALILIFAKPIASVHEAFAASLPQPFQTLYRWNGWGIVAKYDSPFYIWINRIAGAVLLVAAIRSYYIMHP